jgi:hypothetical protein
MKLVINRETWLVGKGHTRTFLARDGKKDVLGFFAAACGATDEQLEGKVMLTKDGPFVVTDVVMADLPNVPEEVAARLTDPILFFLSDMNDAPQFSERDRERLIMEGFENMKVTVKFVHDYPTNMEVDGC